MNHAPISVRFAVTKMDLFWFQLRAMFRNRLILFMFLVWLTIWCSTLSGTVAAPGRSVLFYIFFLGISLLPVVLCFGLLLVFVAGFQVGLSNQRGSVGEHTISLTADGLTESTSFNTSVHRWQGIARVESSSRYLFVFVNDSLCHLIPKRAFTSLTAAQEFEQHVRNYIHTTQTESGKAS